MLYPKDIIKFYTAYLITAAIVCLLILGIFPAMGWSQTDVPGPFKNFSLYWENDAFTGTDKDYSNGIKMTWSEPFGVESQNKRRFYNWIINRLPFVSDTNSQRAISFSLGQSIFTPEDTENPDLVADDRPYAGFSYAGFGFHSKRGRRRDIWEFDIGVGGPLSQAEATQDLTHDTIGVR